MSCFICHLSHVMCHTSSVTCHVLHVTFHVSPTHSEKRNEVSYFYLELSGMPLKVKKIRWLSWLFWRVNSLKPCSRVLKKPNFFRFFAKYVHLSAKLLQNLPNFTIFLKTKFHQIYQILPKFFQILPIFTKFLPHLWFTQLCCNYKFW